MPIQLITIPSFEEYKNSLDYGKAVPFKVTITTANPVVLKTPLLLDSLLAYGVAQRFNQDFPALPSDQAYSIPLPLTEYGRFNNLPIWNASQFFPVNYEFSEQTFYQRSEISHFRLLCPKLKKNPYKTKGQYMARKEFLPLISAEKFEAIGIGIISEVLFLLSQITFLGGKRSQGWGRIIDLKVEETQEVVPHECAFFRPIPVEYLSSKELQERLHKVKSLNLVKTGFTPPYWRKDLHEFCLGDFSRR